MSEHLSKEDLLSGLISGIQCAMEIGSNSYMGSLRYLSSRIGPVILNPLGPVQFSHSEMLHAASVLSDYCSAALARARHLMVGVRGWAAG